MPQAISYSYEQKASLSWNCIPHKSTSAATSRGSSSSTPWVQKRSKHTYHICIKYWPTL